MSDLDFFQHPLFVASISTILSAAVTGLVFTIRNRMARIVYYTSIIPIGISAVYPVFGTIRVSWNDNELNNLFLEGLLTLYIIETFFSSSAYDMLLSVCNLGSFSYHSKLLKSSITDSIKKN